jgi:hypothetical protein
MALDLEHRTYHRLMKITEDIEGGKYRIHFVNQWLHGLGIFRGSCKIYQECKHIRSNNGRRLHRNINFKLISRGPTIHARAMLFIELLEEQGYKVILKCLKDLQRAQSIIE